MLRGTISRFFANDGFFLAAGLSFFFLICVIPLVLIGVSTVGFVLSSEQATHAVIGQLVRNFPVYRHEIERAILRIVQTRRASGLVGTAMLVFFSTPILGACRLVLHRMLGVRGTRGYLRNLLVDASIVLMLGVLLFAGTIVIWTADWLQAFVLEPARVPGRWIDAAQNGVSLLLSIWMFYLAYRFVPQRQPRKAAALAGAVLAAVLWEIAKQLFRMYIRNVGIYDQIYGTLGVLVAFVMFVYYSAMVFVLGASFVASVEARRRG
ncbi:MAG: YihY/virulence factor BrkB family protein [Candidatus Rokubacteria bacterium]|nr:YihY/virulence factor BrkB family protein [Candidatus Rokubacteria bacterium]MBI3827396.1 YihY/virulence factor BrkB family protein [Candidatus Rokubacteria bacterium]